ncbi:JM56 [macacine gammaherpesvirus 11]|uniref:JM56 n=2 Tax=macacine gammaherpesvirus 11 TaxID=2560570 RepID=G9JMN4_9GAMA|nr:JM56 [Macaca fuscata rhadinovirus]AAT00033.1 JM56 [Macaca fuscata rhadinovirus]AEW87581.1 JM56 [Macaca fuscata rhadinovirus]AEW87751.1 JM56 [Macaca fuscata rhadinovirus]
MATQRRDILKSFLNKECIWLRHPGTSAFVRVYTATTAHSAVFDPPVTSEDAMSHNCLNVMIMLMKPKEFGPCVTVYINGDILDFCATEYVAIREVPGRADLCLIRFGTLSNAPRSVPIPGPLNPHPRENVPGLTKQEIIYTSQTVPRAQIQDAIKGKAFKQINPFVWFDGGAFWQLFLSVDYMLLCPALEIVPSLARIVGLLTQCDKSTCKICTLAHVHVNAYRGYTPPDSQGTSPSCPCLISCGARHATDVLVTGHVNLLGLLFDPKVLPKVSRLRLKRNPHPVPIEDAMSGVTAEGTEVLPTSQPWALIRLPDLASRVMLYGCQNLKTICLRSY